VYAKQAGAGQWPEALGLRGRVSVRPVDMQRPQAGTVMGGGVRPLPLGYGLPVKYEVSRGGVPRAASQSFFVAFPVFSYIARRLSL
jgi:hypothetical protein